MANQGQDLEQLQRPRPMASSQSAQIEQARAIEEVRAAAIVAQQFPRDVSRARAEMEDATNDIVLAQRAFYSVPQRGDGVTIHIARELARIWGNIRYGVRELHRDDVAGVSEVIAYAEDLQTNSRAERSFIVPHQKMVGKGAAKKREPIVDLEDVYRNNQNVGAKAVRECIWGVLPARFVGVAEERLRATLKRGEHGESLSDRITKMVKTFGEIGIRQEQIEARIERKRGQWNGGDVADLVIVFNSIRNGDLSKDEAFPPRLQVNTRPADTRPPTTEPPPAGVDPETGETADQPDPNPQWAQQSPPTEEELPPGDDPWAGGKVAQPGQGRRS